MVALPLVAYWGGDGSPSAAAGFLRFTRLVRSVALLDASVSRACCAAGDSPRMDPRIPLRGLAPSMVPVPVGSLMETGGWRISISCNPR